MRLNRLLLVLLLTIAGTWISSVAQVAQGTTNKCSTSLIAGSYSFTCTGTVLNTQGTAVPIAMLGVAFGDAKGNWHGWDTLSFDGTFIPQYLTTDKKLGGVPAVVNSDCSGTVKYQVFTSDPTKSGAKSMGPLPINFAVMNNGAELKGLPTLPGYIVMCQLIRQ